MKIDHALVYGESASELGTAGGSIKTAQALLGHSDVETTLNTYTTASLP
jgi:site-specific recombinase XerD